VVSQPATVRLCRNSSNTLQLTLQLTAKHITTHCNILQQWFSNLRLYSFVDVRTAHCNSLQLTVKILATHCNSLHHTATHCNSLQLTATHCNSLQLTLQQWVGNLRLYNFVDVRTAYCNSLQLTVKILATHCNSLHHNATHCNSMQLTATHAATVVFQLASV